MKKLFYAGLILLAFAACKKDDAKPVDDPTMDTWQFTAGGKTYTGKVVSCLFSPLIGGNLRLDGTFKNGSVDTTFSLSMQFYGGKIETGAFKTEDAGTNFVLQTPASGDIIYAANASAAPPIINIQLVTYDSTAKVVSGTFSGDSYNFDGDNVPVTNGTFKAKLKN